MRNVVSAVEIVIDEHLPVAVDVIGSAIEIMQIADAKRSHARHQSAKELLEGDCIGIEVDENEALPGFHADRNKAVVGPIKILHTLELWHAFERSVEPVLPAVIGALQD